MLPFFIFLAFFVFIHSINTNGNRAYFENAGFFLILYSCFQFADDVYYASLIKFAFAIYEICAKYNLEPKKDNPLVLIIFLLTSLFGLEMYKYLSPVVMFLYLVSKNNTMDFNIYNKIDTRFFFISKMALYIISTYIAFYNRYLFLNLVVLTNVIY